MRITSGSVQASLPSETAIDALINAMLTGRTEDLAIFVDRVTRAQDHTGGFGDKTTSVMNHAAMAAALRRGGLAEHLEARLTASLQASFVHLTGNVVDDVLQPLPVSVLKSVDPLTAAFAGATDAKGLLYALEHYNADSKPAAPASTAERLLFSAAHKVSSLLLATGYDSSNATAANQVALHGPTALPVIAGFGASYVLASFFESFYHHNVAHAESDTVKARRDGHFIQRSFADSFDGHNYHHGIANQHYDVENETDEKKAQRAAAVTKRGRKDLVENHFGVSLSNRGFVKYLAGMVPAYAPAIGAAVLLGAGPVVAAAVAVPMLFVPAASKWMHRYMHLPRDQAKAMLPKFLHPLMETEIWDKMVLRHYVHHERAKAHVNFNILPGALGDKLRDKLEEATQEEIAQARALGLIRP